MPASSFDTGLVDALPRLRRYALSLCRKPDLADDLVQTCVERALAARDRHDGVMRLDAWLFRILRNAWIDAGRRSATRGIEADITRMPEAAVQDGVRDIEALLMLRRTEAAMAGLPDDQRELLVLVCYEELSYAEAALVLGIPTGTVMSRLARARIALAGKLGMDRPAGRRRPDADGRTDRRPR